MLKAIGLKLFSFIGKIQNLVYWVLLRVLFLETLNFCHFGVVFTYSSVLACFLKHGALTDYAVETDRWRWSAIWHRQSVFKLFWLPSPSKKKHLSESYQVLTWTADLKVLCVKYGFITGEYPQLTLEIHSLYFWYSSSLHYKRHVLLILK